MKYTHKYIFWGFLFYIGLLLCVLLSGLTGCTTTRKTVNTASTIKVQTKDSIVTKEVTVFRDSVILRDSLVTIVGEYAEVSLPSGSDQDTVIRKKGLTVSRSVRNGVEKITVDCGQKDVLIRQQSTIIRDKQSENTALRVKVDSLQAVSVSSTTSVKEASRLARWWSKIVNVFAVWGLLVALYLLYKLIRKFTPV